MKEGRKREGRKEGRGKKEGGREGGREESRGRKEEGIKGVGRREATASYAGDCETSTGF